MEIDACRQHVVSAIAYRGVSLADVGLLQGAAAWSETVASEYEDDVSSLRMTTAESVRSPLFGTHRRAHARFLHSR